MELLKRRNCGEQAMCARVFSEGRAEIIVQIEMFANSRFHNFITCSTLPQPAKTKRKTLAYVFHY